MVLFVPWLLENEGGYSFAGKFFTGLQPVIDKIFQAKILDIGSLIVMLAHCHQAHVCKGCGLEKMVEPAGNWIFEGPGGDKG